jgi:hypothetical protein
MDMYVCMYVHALLCSRAEWSHSLVHLTSGISNTLHFHDEQA